MQGKIFLMVIFLLLSACISSAFPSSILDSPPYSGVVQRVDNDDAGQPINAAAEADRHTGKVWLAVAKEDVSLPATGGATVRINSDPITISSTQNIRTDVGVEIPAESIVRNSLAETTIDVSIRNRATGVAVTHQEFLVTSGSSASTRNLVVQTTSPPGAGDYYIGVSTYARAVAVGGIAAIGKGFKISQIAAIAR